MNMDIKRIYTGGSGIGACRYCFRFSCSPRARTTCKRVYTRGPASASRFPTGRTGVPRGPRIAPQKRRPRGIPFGRVAAEGRGRRRRVVPARVGIRQDRDDSSEGAKRQPADPWLARRIGQLSRFVRRDGFRVYGFLERGFLPAGLHVQCQGHPSVPVDDFLLLARIRSEHPFLCVRSLLSGSPR